MQIKVITLIASKLGLQQLLEKHPEVEVEVHLAAIDERAETGSILAGIMMMRYWWGAGYRQ